jgi:hypothetical protein
MGLTHSGGLAITVPLFIFIASLGLVFPNSTAGALAGQGTPGRNGFGGAGRRAVRRRRCRLGRGGGAAPLHQRSSAGDHGSVRSALSLLAFSPTHRWRRWAWTAHLLPRSGRLLALTAESLQLSCVALGVSLAAIRANVSHPGELQTKWFQGLLPLSFARLGLASDGYRRSKDRRLPASDRARRQRQRGQ